MAFLPTAGPGVRAILAADPSFDVARFLEGAKAAYRLVLEAFGAASWTRFAATSTSISMTRSQRRSSSARPTASSSTIAWSRSSRR